MRTTKLNPIDQANDSIFLKSCAYCKKEFLCDNPKAIYCSDSCKSLAYLERKKNADNNEDSNRAENISQSNLNNSDPDEYEKKIYDLEEQVRMSEARNRISDNEYLLLTGVVADKWFDKIYGEKPIILSFDDIIKNCPQLGEILVNDVGQCEISLHGFRTTNFTLMYLCDNKKGYTIGYEDKNDFILTKNN